MEKSTMKRNLFGVFVLFVMFIIGCFGRTVTLNPPLRYEPGPDAIMSMGAIEKRSVSMGLFIEPELRDFVYTLNLEGFDFVYDVGKSFSVNLLKSLSYKFQKVAMLNTLGSDMISNYDGIIIIKKNNLHLDINPSFTLGWVSSEGYVELSVSIEIRDGLEKKKVWSGASEGKGWAFKHKTKRTDADMFGREIAADIDKGIDIAVGSTVKQIDESEEMKAYYKKWGKQSAE